jgi:hypothetical protein
LITSAAAVKVEELAPNGYTSYHGVGYDIDIITNAAPTINLSATGSRKAPKLDVTFNLRARYPSNQSVIAAVMNTTNALVN